MPNPFRSDKPFSRKVWREYMNKRFRRIFNRSDDSGSHQVTMNARHVGAVNMQSGGQVFVAAHWGIPNDWEDQMRGGGVPLIRHATTPKTPTPDDAIDISGYQSAAKILPPGDYDHNDDVACRKRFLNWLVLRNVKSGGTEFYPDASNPLFNTYEPAKFVPASSPTGFDVVPVNYVDPNNSEDMCPLWWMQLPYYIQEEYQIYLMGRNKMSFEQLQRFRRLALGQDNDHTATPAAGWPLHKVDLSLPSYEDAAIAAACVAAASAAASGTIDVHEQFENQELYGGSPSSLALPPPDQSF